MRNIISAAVSVFGIGAFVGCATITPTNFKVTLLHTNDVHARLMQIDQNDQLCKDQDVELGICFGGVARRFTKVEEIRKTHPNVVLLDAGDEFQGTLFYAKHKGQEAQYFMNRLRYQAMAVGNHEFDDGPKVLGRFARQIQFPLLSANLDVSSEPALKDVIKPYTIIDVQNQRIGVIGFTTEETQNISSPGPQVRFLAIEKSVQRAVDELHAKGVKMIFAVSHSGYNRDMEVASRVNGINVIVSGHTNTFLSNVAKNAEGPYPTVVKSPSGEPVLIVSAYAYGKYLGFLEVEFDASGRLAKWNGEPILLDKSVQENAEIANKVAEFRAPLEQMRREVVAEIPEFLDGTLHKCRHEECALGNAVADAILAIAKPYGAVAALMNSGGIRTSLNKGKVTRWNIKDALPFGNEIVVADLSGSALREMLEYAVSGNMDKKTDDTAKFLQVSHLRYGWDPQGRPGQQIKFIEIRSEEGRYEPIRMDKIYRIASNRFLYNGGDGFAAHFSHSKRTQFLSEVLDDALVSHLANPDYMALKEDTRRIKRMD